MAAICVEIDLSADEMNLLEAYIEDHCLDRDKWFKRLLYRCIYEAVGKWKQPVGKVAAAFKPQNEAKGGPKRTGKPGKGA
jgi:uncharacterized protein YqeY